MRSQALTFCVLPFIASVVILKSPAPHPCHTQRGENLVFREDMPKRWVYTAEVTSNGRTIARGTAFLEFKGIAAFKIPDQRFVPPWEWPQGDTLITAGPFRVCFVEIDSSQVDEYLLFETKDGLYQALPNGYGGGYRVRKLLSGHPEVGQSWLESPDSGYRVVGSDSIAFKGREYRTIEVHWYHVPPYGGTTEYRWSLGLGLYELREKWAEGSSMRIVHYRLQSVEYY